MLIRKYRLVSYMSSEKRRPTPSHENCLAGLFLVRLLTNMVTQENRTDLAEHSMCSTSQSLSSHRYRQRYASHRFLYYPPSPS